MKANNRFIWATLIVSIFILFTSITVYMEKQLQGWMEERISSELLEGANTIKSVLTTTKPSFDINSMEALIDTLTQFSRHRVTIVDVDGVVIADSQLTKDQVNAVENHKLRPELLAAKDDLPGISVRYSQTIKKDMMYLAIPYDVNGSKGFIRTSISLSEVDKYVEHLRRIQTIVAVVGFCILAFIILLAFNYLQRLNTKNRKKLKQKVKDKTNDLIKIQKFSHMLSSCHNQDELADVITSTALTLFPNTSGALSITHPSMDKNEIIASWGDNWTGENNYAPNTCWAFRRGAPYIHHQRGLEMTCKHLHSNKSTICVPLLAQSIAIGGLHIIINENSNVEKENQFVTVASHISLALANINLQETLKRQAIRDPLTNLYNRRYLDEIFENEILRSTRQEYSIGVMMIDVDHFKKFNDSFGHAAGDYALQMMGSLLTKLVRGDDTACRYGGEEFIVIMPDTTIESIVQRANDLMTATRETELTLNNKSLGHITLSIGIALFPEHGGSSRSVISVADQALYQAKTNGRDQAIVAAYSR